MFGFGAPGCGFGKFMVFVTAPRFSHHATGFCLARGAKTQPYVFIEVIVFALCSVCRVLRGSLVARGAGFRARVFGARGGFVGSGIPGFFQRHRPHLILLAQPVSPADARVSARVFPVTPRARAAYFGRWAYYTLFPSDQRRFLCQGCL